MTSTTVFAAQRERLEAERDALLAEIAALDREHANHEESAGIGNVVAEEMTEILARERDLALRSNARDLLEQVNAALRRLDEGTYGVCADCGGPIAVERLEALPYATLCIRCQAARERARRW
jgi:DnaK suppressor protein